jgi:hypothetical protein
MLAQARKNVRENPTSTSDLIRKCYDDKALCQLEALKNVYLDLYAGQAQVAPLLWLAITAILRECSGVGTAQWQYVLPNKSKARVKEPFVAFLARVRMMCSDMQVMKPHDGAPTPDLVFADARDLEGRADLRGKVRLVITSPPYPNNYDYADATRLEMTFWGEIATWGDLQKVIRHRLIRSCSQHSAAERLSLDELLGDMAIEPIRDELTAVCRELELVRETKGGKKTYHTMIAAYFADLSRVWTSLRALCAEDADVCFVIGDSAPYGVHVPVDRWLGTLAIAAGFRSFSFEKIRDRNLKWKNRKHRVPLHEGNLWVKA